MSKLREIKRRIGSVNNIAQVTHAMQMVAASRMKRTQENAQRGKPYAEKLRTLMLTISALEIGNVAPTQSNALPITVHPLINPTYSNSDTVLVVVFSPQRGLAGSLPSSLLKFVLQTYNKLVDEGKQVEFVMIGKKVRDSLVHSGVSIVADFSDMPETPTTADVRPLIRYIEERYLSKEIGEVRVLYPEYVSALVQKPVSRNLVPFSLDELYEFQQENDEDTTVQLGGGFVFEPSRYAIFDELIPSYLETQLYQAKLETVASEYSARMVAMKSASENAKTVKEDLTLDFNKSRQAQVTQEISEIVSASNA